jgi:hypothetical protein
VLADHDTWSNPQLQALVQTHARLIQEYKCVERQLQGPAPAAPVVDQGPQANSPLLIPPLNQLAQLRAARAHGENAENAQEEAAQGLRMLDQRRITAAIMKYWAPHLKARALGPPHHRGQVMHPRQLTQTIPCISRTVVGQQGLSLLQASMPDDEELECAPSKRKLLHWTPLAFLNTLGHSTGF